MVEIILTGMAKAGQIKKHGLINASLINAFMSEHGIHEMANNSFKDEVCAHCARSFKAEHEYIYIKMTKDYRFIGYVCYKCVEGVEYGK